MEGVKLPGDMSFFLHESTGVVHCLLRKIMEDNAKDISLSLEHGEKKTLIPYMTRLSDAQIAYTKEFAKQIDVTNRTMVLQYGSAAQKKVSTFTESSLFSVPANDLNEIDQDVRKVLKKLNEFEKTFDSTPDISANDAKSLAKFRTMYDRFSSALTEGARRLEIHRSSLIRHISRMDDLYEQCFQILREYDMYIYAGQTCLKECREATQKELEEQALKTGLMEDTIRAEDYRQSCDLFEKKLNDLCLSRTLPFQILAQIKLIRQTDIVMAESLHRCTSDTFPLYRSRVILSLGLKQSDNEQGKIIDRTVFHEANEDLRRALAAVLKVQSESMNSRAKGAKL